MSVVELRKVLSSKNVVFGTNQTIKNIKCGKVKRVFLASNCPAATKKTFEEYKKVNDFEIIQLDDPGEELMLLCKKNFPIIVLSC
jgi:ribosomal protein L30E|tara:strand:+ start:26134 stop:26388 length:255 start_codon:yes stop_codon:yes gene_type:complete